MLNSDRSIDIPDHSREHAEDFAADYRKYIEGEESIDRRTVNEVIASIAAELASNVREISGEITTTRFNEKIIRTFPGTHRHTPLDSFEIAVDKAAYDAAHLPTEGIEAILTEWLLAKAQKIANEELDRQIKIETDPAYRMLA